MILFRPSVLGAREASQPHCYVVDGSNWSVVPGFFIILKFVFELIAHRF
jgi:hypothetical protein